jgi:diguanylate cyclase (GGDEF)-like protein
VCGGGKCRYTQYEASLRFATAYVVVILALLSAVATLTGPLTHVVPLTWAAAGAVALLAVGLLARIAAESSPPAARSGSADELSALDALTGLPNRRAFGEATEAALRRCAEPQNGSFSVLTLDLDDFKSVNERYGSPAGDRLLAAAARRLRSVLRGNDVVSRTGSDEFAVLISHPRDDGTIAREVGERIVRAFDEPLVVDQTVHLIGASVGLATSSPAHTTVEALLRDAGFAMYRAKDEGRSRLVAFDRELELAAREQSELAAELREALGREDGPRVAFAPIVDLEDGRCCGFEALARWEHPLRGEISASRLVEVARHAQLLPALGRRVVREVCRQLAGWRDDGVPLEQLSIHLNISPAEAACVESCDAIEGALRSYAVPARTLVLELTEDALARDQMTSIFVARLEGLGVRVCLDDFGNGHSSLRNLDEFRVDRLKIDRSFVVSAVEYPGKRSLVAGIVGLAEGLDVAVLAEGIETEEEREVVQQLGCRYAQGVLFGRPLPANEARDLAYQATRRS